MFNLSVKVNPKQKSILFDAMARNRQALEGRTSDFVLRRSKNDLWEKLAAELNMYGPEKDVAQWKKCWLDLRLAMKRKYQKAKKHKNRRSILTDYDRHVIRSCGMDFCDDKEPEECQNADCMVDVSEDEEVKHEQPTEIAPNEFEIVNVPVEEITSDPDLMRGTIKIEDAPLSESESVFLSNDSPMQVLHSMLNSQTIPTCNLSVPAKSDLEADTIIEIRKMHHNLLRESRKQTALLRKLVNRLTH